MTTNKRRIALASTFTAVAVASGITVGVAFAGSAPNRDYNAAVNGTSYNQAQNIPMHKQTKQEGAAEVFNQPVRKLGNGGCTPGYGRSKQCLPHISRAAKNMHMGMNEMPWNCATVRFEGFPRGIRVNNPGKPGADPLNLDTNDNGIACDGGDK